MTLEILVDGLSRQLRQVELYQEKYWCKRIKNVASAARCQLTRSKHTPE